MTPHRVVMTAKDIERAMRRLANEVLERNKGIEGLAFVGIRTGGVFLARRLQRLIEDLEGNSIPMGILDITLYRDDWTRATQHPVLRSTELNFSIDGKKIILVDDVLYTGRTTRAAMDALIDFGRPKEIQLAVLVDRGLRELPIMANYAGQHVATEPGERVNVYLQELAGFDEVRIE
jgi:pyrimidine operon attenuation protein/uracil phosphoribosyltransferase